MASTSTIDALPYYDKQVDDPARKSAAQALIDAELKSVARIEEDDPRLPPKVELFPRSKELQDLADGYPETPIRGIDPSKYNPPVIGPEASLEELIEADKRVRIGQGHMSIRNENASILSSFGPNAWLVRNYQLNGELKELEGVLQGLKDKVTDVNRSRRVFQEATGDHLTRLESRWQDLVGSTVQLEMACGALEGEVRGLKRKEQELKSQVVALEQA